MQYTVGYRLFGGYKAMVITGRYSAVQYAKRVYALGADSITVRVKA